MGLRILLIYGGRSVEHEISVCSAFNIYQGLKRAGHDVFDVHVLHSGVWVRGNLNNLCLTSAKNIVSSKDFISSSHENLVLLPGRKVCKLGSKISLYEPDVVFPVIHGTSGEDGSLQGIFRQVNIPFVGCDVCASACTMDKDITKRLLSFEGIRVAHGCTIKESQKNYPSYDEMQKKFGTKLFVKPAICGSSVGAFLVRCTEDYKKGVKEALRFSSKVLVEEYLVGREIEFALMGNKEIFISPPGEIILNDDFYSYDKKYISSNVSYQVPAKFDNEIIVQCGQKIARDVYEILGCEGLARVDCFLVNEREWIVNEVNTVPGFTEQSLYPRLWESFGKSLEILLNELLELALDRHEREQHLCFEK